jgi:type VI secretion system VasD/TssJ family lipoprotein
MMRATVLLAAVALSFGSCSSVKDYELGLHGSPGLNPNENNRPNPVRVKVLRLKGDESAKAFESADFDDLWVNPMQAKGVVVDGEAQTLDVHPREGRVPLMLKQVPAEVTHVGVLGLFNNPVTGKDRVVLTRDEFEWDVRLHDSVIEKADPEAAPPEPAKKQGP